MTQPIDAEPTPPGLVALERAQRDLLIRLRAAVAYDDANSEDVLTLATQLAANDEAINNILLGG